MNPLVSIIIPVYNAENYINEGLESVMAQTYKNIEVICVDNNSKDKSLTILREWEKHYPNLKVIEEKQQGAPFARNSGTMAAAGEWVQYFDADDYLYPHKIESQINLINDSANEADIVFEGWEMLTLAGQKIKFEILKDVWKGIFNGRIGHTNSVLIKKNTVLKAGGWDESLKSSQERDLFFRILKTNPSYILSENFGSLFIKRKDSITTTKASASANTLRFVQLRQRILDYIIEEKKEQFETYKTWYLSLFLEGLRFLYPYNAALSKALYSKYCYGQKIEAVGSMSKMYLRVMQIFGFDLTEKIYSFLRRLKTN